MIALDTQTFKQSRVSGNVTGVIFLGLEGCAFPEPGWCDFPVIILGWWTDAWFHLEVRETQEVQWPFMDGPYAATLSKIPAGSFRSSQVYAALLQTAECVAAHCEQKKMVTKDLELLHAT